MGKTFINKLGSFLRVFKSGRKREFRNEKDDSINITSESGIRIFESWDRQESDRANRNPILQKSKSSESIATGTLERVTIRVNELKRSHGSYDILSSNKEEEVKCTKSLNRFCQLTHTNNIVLSYHVKLHDSTIWSRALGRVTQRPNCINSDYTSSSTIQVEGEESLSREQFFTIRTRPEKTIASFQELKIDKSNYAKPECPNVVKKQPENVRSPQRWNEESDVKVSISSDTQTYGDMEKTCQKPTHENMDFSKNNKVHQFLPLITDVNRKIYEVPEEIESQLESSISIHPTDGREYTESSKITVDEQNPQVKTNFKTIKNEEGFDLLKYDVKSSGDHVIGPITSSDGLVHSSYSTDVIIDPNSYDSEEQQNSVNSSKVLSDNSTEYEGMNQGQFDLFKEFKTTISKMRNVLNVLEVKKSSQGTGPNLCVSKMGKNECSPDVLEAENISTQTAEMTFNPISTSTDGGGCNRTRNEGIMVQLSSETTTKCKSDLNRITLDTDLLNYMEPLKKRRIRRKRGNRFKYKKVRKRGIYNVSSSQDGQLKIKMKPEKPHYNKCIVYHITQHKNAVDRCVGTPYPAAKEKLILKNAFSALHFGPIQEFPMLLNKIEHEKEKKKKQEQEKVKTIALQKDLIETNYHRRKSTSLLSSELSKSSNQTSCLKSKTQPSLRCGRSRNYSSLSTSTTTTNWFVLKPSPPLVMKKRESTSNDLLFDANRSSTQELVSNILEEELKTSGLKGRISSSTMNLIKDQFCDKLSGMKSKDIPDVMITICVPLKNIVSKIKTSKRGRCEDKAISFSNSTPSNMRCPSSSSFDKGIQVNGFKNYVNDNLQTIPEKMSRKSTEIYQHNKLLRDGMSSRRLSTFKKIFGNKATSCSNINPFGHLARRTSRIYFSDHSTSSPEFAVKPIFPEAVRYANKKISTTPKSSSASLFRGDGHISRNKKEGFFLNLPHNRYRKKREQISKLFDESDSSEWKYFGEPKLLYHMHDSSFYSTSKTDDKHSSRRNLLETTSSNVKSEVCYFPVQQASSRRDIRVKPRYISFCDFPRKLDSEVQTPKIVLERPTKDNGHLELASAANLRNADVNTSKVIFFQNNETQYETEANVAAQASANERKSTRKNTKRIVGTDNVFVNSIDEFSVVSLPKVHFKDEVKGENFDTLVNTSTQNCCSELYGIRVASMSDKIDEIVGETPKKSVSVLSLFAKDNEIAEDEATNIIYKGMEDSEINKDAKVEYSTQEQRKKILHHQSNMILQTSSDSNLMHMEQEQSGVQLGNTTTTNILEKKQKRKESKDIVRMKSTQVGSITSLPKKEHCLVQVETPNETRNESRLTVLMRDVVNLCNSSFVKSRDCIVELTLYNLIKEIILEHCSHLSEQSRQKIESILANFIELSKEKVGDRDVNIVESAIENLVREIHPTDVFAKNNEEKYEGELYEECDQDTRGEHTCRHKRKTTHSRSKHREHKHESKHRSRHEEAEEGHRGKHNHRDEEKKHKTKRRHKHHCDNDDKCDRAGDERESKFRSVDGKREYLELVQRLKELEEVTKQLSNVAQNQQNIRPQFEDDDYLRKHKNWYTEYLFAKPKYSSRKKTPFTRTQKKPVEVNYFQTELERKISSIPRKLPKLPVTKIIINVSNLKLLARNCVSLKSTSIKQPMFLTDSTEGKQKLMNTIVSYDIDNECRSRIRHSSNHQEKNSRHYLKDTRSEMVNRNKESFTITIHGKEKRRKNNFKEKRVKSSKNKKDYMRIKMVRKKKTVTSKSDQTTPDIHCARRINTGSAVSNDLHEITKQYINGEYKMNSNFLSSIAKGLLEDKSNIDQIFDSRGNLDLAYQRMANFCLFRGLLRKD